MNLRRPPPRHPLLTRDAAKNREEQRRFDLMTNTWNEAQLRRACQILKLPQDGRSVDQMQMDLVTSQAHRLDSENMSKDTQTGQMEWPDPLGLFNSKF
jgi:hypothetical protein